MFNQKYLFDLKNIKKDKKTNLAKNQSFLVVNGWIYDY
ncbi:hypothetical protein RV04_GL000351 [Enterococcus hermanniensis]|uniref:Uncharacterized protein n=1 Tax=Enterococcus hermanniensis TaxID=249189 RepID=A0A1L8TSU6_9ENTE|nr:hypothetical protein RV04_GL000351 [Enterococcus hermanniensis]